MSILEINANSLVCGLYDKLRGLLHHGLVEHTPAGQLLHRYDALVVSISTSFSHYGFEPDGNTLHEYGERYVQNYCHFLLCGNVHVWAYVGPCSEPMDVPLDEWQNTSNHNSCWRSDGMRPLSKLYFDSCDEVQEHLPERLQQAPNDVHHYCTAGRFMGESVFGFVEITFRQSDQDNYGYKLTSVARSSKALTLQGQEQA